MKLVHSFFTQPYRFTEHFTGSNLRSNITCFALSVAYAKQNGFEIELYTDNLGKKFLDFLPYDVIHTDLEGFKGIQGDTNFGIWSAGKIEAYKRMALGDVHIDGDVFIKNSCLKGFLVRDFDVMFQSHENTCIGIYNTCLNFAGCEWLYPVFRNSKKTLYNVGILCFKSQNAKDKYIAAYEALAKIIVAKGAKNLGHTNLFLEQALAIEAMGDVKIDTVLQSEDPQWEMPQYGLEHIVGHAKYQPQYMNRFLKELQEVSSSIYTALQTLDIEAIIAEYDNAKVAQPEEALPNVAQPKVEQPKVAQPEEALPNVAQPEVEQPEVAQPKVEQPEVAQPEVEQPEVAQPKVEQPEVAEDDEADDDEADDE
ncbi:MAG: hypothetical protein LBS50_10980 [Prevotellaceae bacterium]|jgi:hypothetical protein|nr:hypothetical protein [Prevotellaceae bacterium]